MELKINTLFQKALRSLDADEYAGLSRDIEANGCHTPIMTWRDWIIDGHNRYQICRETGQSFNVEYRDNDFEDETDVLIWILDNALSRRNLDFGDKKRYIGELYNLKKIKDEERASRDVDTSVHVGSTSENIGSKFGVSGRTVRRYATEAERQKVLEELKAEVFKKAVREGKTEDEDWMTEQMNEASESLRSDDDIDGFDGSPDDFNQGEPTDDQVAAKKATQPKRSPSKSKGIASQQKNALKGYEFALSKIQGLRLDLLFDGSLELPDFAACYASIEAERAKLPVEKKRFGR